MSSEVYYVSSGSEGDETKIEAKKRKRMISNRESARRSRKKKQQHMEDLLREVDMLKRGNVEIGARIDLVRQRQAMFESENGVLAARKVELNRRLDYLNNVADDAGRNEIAVRTWQTCCASTSPLQPMNNVSFLRNYF